MPRKGKMSFEEKRRLAQACISKEMGVYEAARMAQVDHATVRRWIKQYETEAADGLLPHTRLGAVLAGFVYFTQNVVDKYFCNQKK